MTSSSSLCFHSAAELARMIAHRHISAVELLETHLKQIEALNPVLNAIVTLESDHAYSLAKKADETLSRGGSIGPLHGLPIAHKDLTWTKGIRTTFGSRIFKDFVPDHDALIVTRLTAAGAITIGKTNTPEFGAGSQTFNELFGATHNPYDTSKTCGGSSGGAAVALAAGMIPIADGSDLGGSLRNPASFCNVVGFRPSPGRVPIWPNQAPWFPLGVQGPMARTVEDIALIMRVIAGPDARDPLSLPDDGDTFHQSLSRNFDRTLVAWSPNLNGLPVDVQVTQVLKDNLSIFESIGCVIEEECPDLSDAIEVFNTWRAWYFHLCYGDILLTKRQLMKDTVIWNIEKGGQLTGPDLGKATRAWHRIQETMSQFMARYEYFILPVSQVPPFDIRLPYVTSIAGTSMNSYLDWMSTCTHISVLGLPAISVPFGFTKHGLPIGIQIVGRRHNDYGVLQLAHAIEQAIPTGRRRPAIEDLAGRQIDHHVVASQTRVTAQKTSP